MRALIFENPEFSFEVGENMHVLEENFIRSLMLLKFLTDKILNRFKELNISDEEFKNKHIAYSDLHMTLCHNAIFQARKLYEASIRDGLTEPEWLKLKGLREEITHARDIESQEIKKIADLNSEIIPILNKLSLHIFEKNKIQDDPYFDSFSKVYLEDINKL
jgi:hypothetical protein